MKTRRFAQILIASAALSAAPALAQTDAVPPSDVPALKTSLYDANAKTDQREQAAQRLLARPDPTARDLLRGALADHGQPAVQLAAAKALANHPVADPTLKKPLFDLLEKDNAPWNAKDLIDAAARALTAFKTDPDTLNRLLALSTTGDERVRTAAIKAAGTFAEKRAADGLIPLTDVTSQPYAVATAATEAMAYLTSQPASTDWRAWWDANKGKTDAQFRADLVGERSTRYDLARMRVAELEDEFFRTLGDLYQRTPRDGRTDLLLRFMRSPESSVRLSGCKIAQNEAASAVTILPQTVKEQLRQLVGDASPQVRLNAARALALINDSDAVVPLLTQLNQETDSDVKAAIADALRPTRDARAIPALLAMLDDPAADAATAAAEALIEVAADLRQKDPAAADRVAEKVIKTLQTRTTAQNGIDLRDSLVQALGALQSRAATNVLQKMLASPAEDRRVRRSLLKAIGDYKNPDLTQEIVPWMSDPNDAGTRLAAVRAFGESADNLGDYDRQLADRLQPRETREVRDAAWGVVVKLLAKATGPQLGVWETRLRNDPKRLLVILREQRDRAVTAGNADLTAGKNQQIGDALVAIGDPTQYREAIAAYRAALEYAEKNQKANIDELVSVDLTRALLLDRQFQKAIDFTQQKIQSNRKFQDLLGPEIRKGAERLALEQKDYLAANELIDMALKMKDPSLTPNTVDMIKSLQANIRTRFDQQNARPAAPEDAVQTAMR